MALWTEEIPKKSQKVSPTNLFMAQWTEEISKKSQKVSPTNLFMAQWTEEISKKSQKISPTNLFMAQWTEEISKMSQKISPTNLFMARWTDEKEEDTIKKKAQHKMQELQQMLRSVDDYLRHAPEGSLKIQQRLGNTYYYHQQKNDETGAYSKHYFSKKDENRAKSLAQKGYYSKVKPLLEKNLHALEQFLNTYDEDEIERVYDSFIDERKKLVKPIKVSIKEQLRRWNEDTCQPYNNHPENLRYETEKGELVRSKSEVIIANILYQHRKDLLYKYERPLEVMIAGRVHTIHPDFTILNLQTGHIHYWEHAGRMDDVRYANDFVQKMNTYIENGIFPGKDVIVTYETMNSPLNIHNVKILVKCLLVKE